MMAAGLFNPSLNNPVVQVTSTEDRQVYNISWPAQSGATGYRVYAGFDPIHVRSLVSGSVPLPPTQTSFLFSPSSFPIFSAPYYPPGQVIYFWIRTESASPEFISEIGSYLQITGQRDKFTDTSRYSETSLELIDPDDSLYYMEEIRRRAKAILEDTSEEVDLYIKQWRGMPDPTTQDQLGTDPNYQGMTRDDRTYGTGFFPGFFPPIRILMRFGNLPPSQLDFQVPGMRPLLPNEVWTIWAPIMHENDLIVRVQTGQRYVVSTTAFGNWRSVPLTQRATVQVVNPDSPLQKVTDSDVRAKWGLVNSVDYARVGLSIATSTPIDTDLIIV
jgi:hypothetical protein